MVYNQGLTHKDFTAISQILTKANKEQIMFISRLIESEKQKVRV